ncbi:hypothetical protein BaRGS_00003209 [Batillaria attramentaria]|uniref:Uncharacterized protein n=1 Tax=Batillaria attramentaria TaxID=370345 RepID=A0ABD0M2C1_9CAEN
MASLRIFRTSATYLHHSNPHFPHPYAADKHCVCRPGKISLSHKSSNTALISPLVPNTRVLADCPQKVKLPSLFKSTELTNFTLVGSSRPRSQLTPSFAVFR